MNETDDFSVYIVVEGDLDFVQDSENGVKFVGSLKVFNISYLLLKNLIKAGDMFGTKSFFTDEPREISIRSRNFSTLFEIKQADFLKIIRKNAEDYEKYVSLKDQIKLYSNYSKIYMKCACCKKNTHIYNDCPLIHYIPDADFLIKRQIFPHSQERGTFPRKKQKKFNARSNISSVQSAILGLESGIFTDGGDIYCDENEEEILENLSKNHEEEQKSITETESARNQSKQINEDELTIIKSINKEELSLKKMPFKNEWLMKFPTNDEQNFIEPPSVKRTSTRGLIMIKNSPVLKTEEFIQRNIVKHSFEENGQINSSFNRITRPNRQKKTLILEREESKDKTKEKQNNYSLCNAKKMYDYEFEKMKNYNHYFEQNNINQVIVKIIKNKASPKFLGSRESIKKKIERRMRSSKFFIQSNFEIKEMRNSAMKNE